MSALAIIWAAVGFIGPAAQFAVSFLRKPAWAKADETMNAHWRKYALISLAGGLLAASLALIFALAGVAPSIFVAMAGPVGYVATQSLITDIKVRYVDRWIMRIANAITLAAGVYALVTYGTEAELVVFAIFALAAFAIGFMPGVGESDGRAFQMLVFSVYPLFGTNGLTVALVGYLIALLVFAVAAAIKKKIYSFKMLVTSMSMPIVPLVLTPMLVTLFAMWFI